MNKTADREGRKFPIGHAMTIEDARVLLRSHPDVLGEILDVEGDETGWYPIFK